MSPDTVTVVVRGNDNTTASTYNAHDADSTIHLTAGNAPTASSAAKLTTARTLWGESFDGTANVSGPISLQNEVLNGATQVSGNNIGFDLFTPTANLTYRLLIAGKDVTDGNPPNNAFIDEVVFNATGGGWTVPTPWHSQTVVGAPGARTYTNATGKLHIAIANGITWYIDIVSIKFAS
jgi:hypothetical protein